MKTSKQPRRIGHYIDARWIVDQLRAAPQADSRRTGLELLAAMRDALATDEGKRLAKQIRALIEVANDGEVSTSRQMAIALVARGNRRHQERMKAKVAS